MAGERRLYLERNCRLPESPAHSRRRNREGPASSKGLNSQRGFGPAVEPRRKSRPRSTSLHGSSPCKCQRLSTLRWDRLPPSRPSTKSGARAGGRRLSDRRLHRWLAGTSASAPSSHGAADLLGLNRAHICVRNLSTVAWSSVRPSPGRARRPASLCQQALGSAVWRVPSPRWGAALLRHRSALCRSTSRAVDGARPLRAGVAHPGPPRSRSGSGRPTPSRPRTRLGEAEGIRFWSVGHPYKAYRPIRRLCQYSPHSRRAPTRG